MRGARAERVLTDLVSLVRHAVQMDDELVPYPELVRRRYDEWLTPASPKTCATRCAGTGSGRIQRHPQGHHRITI